MAFAGDLPSGVLRELFTERCLSSVGEAAGCCMMVKSSVLETRHWSIHRLKELGERSTPDLEEKNLFLLQWPPGALYR